MGDGGGAIAARRAAAGVVFNVHLNYEVRPLQKDMLVRV